MRPALPLAFFAPALSVALTLAPVRDAEACGGFFNNPSESTQVASHRMILSISQTQSTLYDEIQYSGSPSSFAWVLPIKGMVIIGVASDALFAQLDQLTAVTVSPPNPHCEYCSVIHSSEAASTSSSTSSGSGGGVTVVSQTVVGPYETVQLSSANPTALTDWLTMHGYNIPTDVAPIISAYVSGGFNFLALKLVPGASVTAMQPVRVTTPGAAPVLPLRMVAAGVGATVPITLFVVGEGRYQPTNFPWFTIDPTQLVWDFATESSNYATLRQKGFAGTGGKGWLVESATPVSEESVTLSLSDLAMNNPLQSGYADSMGNGAPMAEQADMATLFNGIAAGSLWITRLLAELPRTALSTDLTVGAAAAQVQVPTTLTPPTYIHTPCPCGVNGAGGGGGGTTSQSSSCAIGATGEQTALLSGLMAGMAALFRRRRPTGRRSWPARPDHRSVAAAHEDPHWLTSGRRRALLPSHPSFAAGPQ
jgi:hypothetical protein